MQKRLLFTIIFALFGFIALQIPVAKLAGSNVAFTLFDFVGPIAGAFLGGPLGILAVLGVNLANFAFKGFPMQTGEIIRLFPTLFAVWYFSLNPSMNSSQSVRALPLAKQITHKLILGVPLLAMIAFWLHPEGQKAWYYALFWIIPVAAFFQRKHLFLRALGATFTAHAVGGAAWIWAFNLQASVWQGLIPVVIRERIVFALGITLAFIVMTNLIIFLNKKKLIPKGLRLEKAYHFLPR